MNEPVSGFYLQFLKVNFVHQYGIKSLYVEYLHTQHLTPLLLSYPSVYRFNEFGLADYLFAIVFEVDLRYCLRAFIMYLPTEILA